VGSRWGERVNRAAEEEARRAEEANELIGLRSAVEALVVEKGWNNTQLGQAIGENNGAVAAWRNGKAGTDTMQRVTQNMRQLLAREREAKVGAVLAEMVGVAIEGGDVLSRWGERVTRAAEEEARRVDLRSEVTALMVEKGWTNMQLGQAVDDNLNAARTWRNGTAGDVVMQRVTQKARQLLARKQKATVGTMCEVTPLSPDEQLQWLMRTKPCFEVEGRLWQVHSCETCASGRCAHAKRALKLNGSCTLLPKTLGSARHQGPVREQSSRSAIVPQDTSLGLFSEGMAVTVEWSRGEFYDAVIEKVRDRAITVVFTETNEVSEISMFKAKKMVKGKEQKKETALGVAGADALVTIVYYYQVAASAASGHSCSSARQRVLESSTVEEVYRWVTGDNGDGNKDHEDDADFGCCPAKQQTKRRKKNTKRKEGKNESKRKIGGQGGPVASKFDEHEQIDQEIGWSCSTLCSKQKGHIGKCSSKKARRESDMSKVVVSRTTSTHPTEWAEPKSRGKAGNRSCSMLSRVGTDVHDVVQWMEGWSDEHVTRCWALRFEMLLRREAAEEVQQLVTDLVGVMCAWEIGRHQSNWNVQEEEEEEQEQGPREGASTGLEDLWQRNESLRLREDDERRRSAAQDTRRKREAESAAARWAARTGAKCHSPKRKAPTGINLKNEKWTPQDLPDCDAAVYTGASGICDEDGLFAAVDFQPGDIVVAMIAPLKVTREEGEAHMQRYDLPSDSLVDYEKGPKVMTYFDQSWTDANTRPQWHYLNHGRPGNTRPRVRTKGRDQYLYEWVASKRILVGEEITFDYGEPDPEWSDGSSSSSTSTSTSTSIRSGEEGQHSRMSLHRGKCLQKKRRRYDPECSRHDDECSRHADECSRYDDECSGLEKGGNKRRWQQPAGGSRQDFANDMRTSSYHHHIRTSHMI
jgi:hypothetical protein